MAFLSKVHLSCFLLSYVVAFGGELFQVLRSRSGFSRGVILVATVAGLIAHTAYLVTRSVSSGLPPLVGSSHDWLLVLAWLGAVLYVLAQAIGGRIALGLFLLPVVIALIGMALFVDRTPADQIREVATHRWGMLHAAALVIGMGCVSAATICAMMCLIQYQKLRGKSTWLHRLQLPSLERLNETTRWLVTGTVIMLTIGLLTGFILAMGQGGELFRWSDPIVSGTLIVWAIMVAALTWLLKSKEQTGRQVARLTLLAGGFLLLTVFGLMLISGGVHGSSPDADAAVLLKRSGPIIRT